MMTMATRTSVRRGIREMLMMFFQTSARHTGPVAASSHGELGRRMTRASFDCHRRDALLPEVLDLLGDLHRLILEGEISSPDHEGVHCGEGHWIEGSRREGG